MDHDLLNNLSSKNKLQRRNALNQLQNKFEECEILTLELYNYYEIPLLSAVSDNSEANRYIACVLIETILQKKLKPDNMIKYVIPTIHHRLCSKPVIEDCEENRLEFLTLIMNMIDVYENVHLYINEICDILCAGLKDSYPEIVLRSCDCIIKLSTALKSRFPMFCNSFFKNLVHCIHKNRLRVRVKALNTLECLYTCGNFCEFDEANAMFCRCLIDVPQVRLALLTFGYNLCIRMPHRYSYWSKILPFVLFSLRDSDQEIKQKSSQFWKEIGEQYERENDIKKSAFFIQIDHEICPEEVRDLDFSVGCCALIERNFYKMLENLVSDTKNWQEEVRLNALKLLTVCILGLKENCLQYSKKFIDVFGYSVSDNDPRISKESLLCAKVLGMFLPPDLYIPLVEPGLWGDSDNFFLIFASLTQTTPTSSLKQYSQEFLKVLHFSNIENKISPVKQEMISKLCVQLFTNCEIENFNAGWFLSLIYVCSMNPSKEKENIEKSLVLEHVARSFGHESVEDFISEYIETCLEMLYDDNIWFEEDDPSLCAFLCLSHFKGFHTQLDIVSKILKTKLDYKNAPLVAFAILRGLTEVFQRVSCSEDENLIKKWCSYVVNEHILKMLSYKQSRTGESLRLASVSSLLSIVTSCVKSDIIYQAIEKCFEYIEGLICEDFVETRILSCRLIEVLLNKFKSSINLERSSKFLEILMKKLDDINVKVRRVAASTLENCVRFYCLPDSTMNEEDMRKIVSNVAVYFREEDTFIQKSIAGILNDIKVMNRDLLESELRKLECEDILEDLD